MWTTLKLDPTSLTDARLLAHWASQLLAAVGAQLVPKRPDDSHTSLHFEHESRAIVGETLDEGRTRVGLQPAGLTLLILSGDEQVWSLPLAGKTLIAARGELRAQLSRLLGRDVPELAAMSYEMPEHPVGGGAPFDVSAESEALGELERWIANAHDLVEHFVKGDDQASPVRLWPHHFDLASLITVQRDEDPEKAKSVNVGFSFGDGSYPEPYVYVSPWPYPASRNEAPALRYGKWHNEGFFAAVFTGSDLLAGGAEGQAERVEHFLVEASDQSRTMLG